MSYNWIGLIVAVVAVGVLFVSWRSRRYWPGAVGWAIDILSIGFLVAIDFGDYTALGIAGLIIGTVLAFTGFLIGRNSPVSGA